MDRHGWLWKKRASDRTVNEKSEPVLELGSESLASVASLGDQENYKNVNYVQVSVDKFTHLIGLEDQVTTLNHEVAMLEEQVKDLNEKLSDAHSEINKKDSLVQQHIKVAEEAVSGWEAADAQTLALKYQLECVTLSKLAVEDRASNLDGALRECMRQIRIVKKENETFNKLISTKTAQWDRTKRELVSRVAELDQALFNPHAENAAPSCSSKDCSNMLIKINEEKAQADAEIEVLKDSIQSCERELHSVKYEVHIVSNELDIRNEEKNMSLRSAEDANRKHLEAVKEIDNLEAESHRLRGLVRKKLPGPAAPAQMKHKIGSSRQDPTDTQPCRTSVKNHPPSMPQLSKFPTESSQNVHKETESLSTQLSAMKEEAKMLREALIARTTEVETSKRLCSKMSGTIKELEAQVHILEHQSSSPESKFEIPNGGSSTRDRGKHPSQTSMSEDGIDGDSSSAESWAGPTLIPDHKPEMINQLHLMDDFLEMEMLACLSSDPGGAVSTSSNTETLDSKLSYCSPMIEQFQSKQLSNLIPSTSRNSNRNLEELEPYTEKALLLHFQSNVLKILESELSSTNNKGRILKEIKHLFEDMHLASNGQVSPLDIHVVTAEGVDAPPQQSTSVADTRQDTMKNIMSAVSQIHQFISFLEREGSESTDICAVTHGLRAKYKILSSSAENYSFDRMNILGFMVDLSHVLAKVYENYTIRYKDCTKELSSADCVDKVTLLENSVVQSDHTTDLKINSEVQGTVTSGMCSSQELEQMKNEKSKVELDLENCREEIASTKLLLHETEQHLSELKLQLVTSQKDNSLSEVHLKCMTESYKELESRAQQLEDEVNVLRSKTVSLESELRKEKQNGQNTLAQCMDLQEQIKRYQSCSVCSSHSLTGSDTEKIAKEKEIAAAAEKLAECQETIYLLGKQLKSLHTRRNTSGSISSESLQMEECLVKEEQPGQSISQSKALPPSNKVHLKVMENGTSSGASSNGSHGSQAEDNPNLPPNLYRSVRRHGRSTSASSPSGLPQQKQSVSLGRLLSLKDNEP